MNAKRGWSGSLYFVSVVLVLIFAAGAWAQKRDRAFYSELRWRCIGPFRGGRTVAMTGVPGQPNVFYMAPNNGGVWKTTDYGQTWNPIFDGQPTGSIGAIAVAPSHPDVVFVGSGEGLRRPDLSTGDGIYRTSDGGKTWIHLGLRDGQQITNILVDPQEPNRVYAAVLGHPYGPNAERGVFRSGDGGMTWEKILGKDENTGATDLQFDPKNAQTIYAVLWNSRRPPWTTSGPLEGHTGGLFKTTDGGSTWRQIGKGLPTNEQKLGRIGIGIAPNDPNRIYAFADAPELGGLFRSDDAGDNFVRVNNEDRIWGRGFDFAWVRVAPDNREKVYICNTSMYRSLDGGKTFTAIKGAPGGDDYHTIWINPENPQILAMGVDQGATISVNGGETWSSWYNQPTAQFYHVVTDNEFPYWVYGGQQESGSVGTASRSDWGEITFREWYPVGTEEYGYVAPDPLHPNWIYGGKGTRFDRLTGQTKDVSPVIIRTGKYRFNRTAPLIFSQADPHALYLGSNVLFKTVDGGNSWKIVSPDLTREDPGVPATIGGLIADDPAKGKHRGVIYSVAPSPLDANLIWAGTDDGLIWVTRDGGANWTNVTPTELTPWSKVAQLDASHFDKDTVYAAVNRFRLDDLHAYVYRTHDGGKTWQKVTNGIPDDAAVNVVREDSVKRGLLFAGTERAVWVSFNDGDAWEPLQMNLPATSMRDLVVHGDDVVVGTHGRSFWILDDITPLRQRAEFEAAKAKGAAFLFKPGAAYRVKRNVNPDTPLPPEEPAGKNPPDGAILGYYISAAKGSVKIEIFDSGGKLVRAYSNEDKPEVTEEQLRKELNVPLYWVRSPEKQIPSAEAGPHRFVWDLRTAAPKSLAHEYPISAIAHDTPRYPLGAIVPPGEYKVQLSTGGETVSQTLNVKMDPRVKVTEEELKEQWDAEAKICEAMNSSYDGLLEVRSARAQLKERAEKLQGRPPALAQAIKALEKRTAPLEGAARKFGPPVKEDSFGKLNGELGLMLASVDSADGGLTATQRETLADVAKAMGEVSARWNELKAHDLAALNERLLAAGMNSIDVQAPVAAPAESDDGEDEP